MEDKMADRRVLIVDDSEATLDVLGRNLSAMGFEVTCATGAAMALEHIDAGNYELMITDIKMPGMSGMDLLAAVRKKHPDLPVMMITGYATIPGAVKAMENGALEYLSKPFTKAELSQAVKKVMEKISAARSAGMPPLRVSRRRFGLVGKDPAMAAVFSAMELAAEDEGAPVLFVGESGTGRRSAARGLAGGALLEAWDGAAIPEGAEAVYIESLDLLPKESLSLVAEALRKRKKIGPRIMAGASPGITARMNSESFPEILRSGFSRHMVIMPPLRGRKEDIRRLLLHCAMRVLENPLPCWPVFSEPLLRFLEDQPWPGNVAELINVAGEMLAGFSGRPIEISDLPARFARRSEATPLLGPLAEAEAIHIRRVLESVGGNKSKAAEILGITRKTLHLKLQENKEE